MQNMSDILTPGLPVSRRQRLFGYCGRGGEASAQALATARSAVPEGELVASVADIDNGRFGVFGLAASGVPSLAHAHLPDGSFMMIDGQFLDRSDDLQQILSEWMAEGVATFRKHRFHGFVAAWNAGSSTCVLLRGPSGIVPGFIAEVDQGLVYSTDLAPLLRFGVDPTPSDVGLDAFLATGYFPAPMSPVAAVSKIPVGHMISITEEGVTESAPWSHHHHQDLVGKEEATELLPGRFRESLERRWPSDGDAGLMLSGGIDSSVILVGATQMLGRPMRSFTFRYEDYQGALNEGDRARAIADHLGVAHEEIPIRPQDIFRDLARAVAAYGEPFTWGLHSYRMGPVADHGITTVFSGSGSTDLSKRHSAAVRFYRLPAPVRGSIRAAVIAARPLNLSSQAKSEWVTEPVSGLSEIFSDDSEWNRKSRRKLYQDPSLADRSASELLQLYQDAADEYETDDLDLTIKLHGKRFTAAEGTHMWNRAWSLAAGLELALPYYDHDLLELGMNLEDGVSAKQLFRELAGQYLPDEMANAPKLPQQMPVNEWIRGPLKEPFRERLLDLPERMTSIFEPASVAQLLEQHVSGKVDRGWRLIALLTIAEWFDQLPGRSS
jgi:asparagine synthase (glutamine-hydrolysing)